MDKEKNTTDKKKLQQMLNNEITKQVEECKKELNEVMEKVLNKHQCKIDISMMIGKNSITPIISVVPKSR